MKKVANILTGYDKSKFSEMYNVIKSMEDSIDGIPTLIIGLDNAKKYIKNFNILKKEYPEQKLWWTYKKTERRCDFEDDILSFNTMSINSILDNIKYEYVDILNYKPSRIKKLIKYTLNYNHKVCFLTKNSNFLFLYDEKYKTVFGLSLNLCEYIGIPKIKVVRLVRRQKNNHFINGDITFDGEIMQIIGKKTHYILPMYEYFHIDFCEETPSFRLERNRSKPFYNIL